MTTYVYETIPTKPNEKARYFEIKQSMKDDALTRHPETGEPIRRVVLGGFGLLHSKGAEASGSGSGSSSKSGGGGSCGCGAGGCGR